MIATDIFNLLIMKIRREDRSFPRDSVRRRVWNPGLLWWVVEREMSEGKHWLTGWGMWA